MDGSRFDDLARLFARGDSRRRVLKGVGAVVASGVAASLGRSEADAKRVTQAYCGNKVCAGESSVCNAGCDCCVFGNGNSRCMPPKDCQRLGGEAACDPTAACCADADCPATQTCESGTCTCPGGMRACGDVCFCGCSPDIPCQICPGMKGTQICSPGMSCVDGRCTA
jgi:hypothetical protein